MMTLLLVLRLTPKRERAKFRVLGFKGQGLVGLLGIAKQFARPTLNLAKEAYLG
ncbi:hypothetical protein [Paucibacter sp. KBW04]|uniref:hypothetical protein n=1 Tax=Paucibacter sp. KBW04 TaxID=2153361 RepID=UPI0012DBE284|nr:hypothetical protein [Paucibacter sp. KBW04]